MTGDLTANREARIVVMTTEIFRNMLYAEIDHSDVPFEGGRGGVKEELPGVIDVSLNPITLRAIAE